MVFRRALKNQTQPNRFNKTIFYRLMKRNTGKAENLILPIIANRKFVSGERRAGKIISTTPFETSRSANDFE